jgi:pimeloyl-ACP methyl ester carboxylesterase
MLDDVNTVSRFVTTREVRLHVVEAGPPDGPPVLLLHGFPEFWYGWRHQIGPLAAAGHRVIVPDLRGYNLSDKPAGIGAYRIDRLALDMVDLLDALGCGRALVAAHDWGAVVGWWLGIAHPERVARLAILNVPHPLVMRRFLRTSWAQIRRSWYIFFFQLPGLPERWFARDDFQIGRRFLKSTSRRGTFGDEDLARYVAAWRQPGAPTAMINWYRAALRCSPPVPASPRVSVPTRILWGLEDRALGREMVPPSAALCDQVEVFYLDGVTHWVQHEAKETVLRHLLELF